MTNPHIELVEKWLEDPDSVTQEELEANKEAAYAYSGYSAYSAAYSADAADAADAKYWVKRYYEITGE